LQNLAALLRDAGIAHEILVINDNSFNDTEQILVTLSAGAIGVRYVNNPPPNGFGFAVRRSFAARRWRSSWLMDRMIRPTSSFFTGSSKAESSREAFDESALPHEDGQTRVLILVFFETTARFVLWSNTGFRLIVINSPLTASCSNPGGTRAACQKLRSDS